MTTEKRNQASANIDTMTPLEIVDLMNQQDEGVPAAVATQREAIARAIAGIAERLRRGGRLFYQGAGTSGRLGVLDASECPPTFNTDPRQVVGLIAGGHAALVRAVEGAEDEPHQALVDLQQHEFSAHDCLVGIATSGRTPYVLAGLQYARKLGALTIGFTCNAGSAMQDQADILIAPVVGPEVISGSTRLKAGTATKMVLNMLTTGAMVRLGKTHGNLMVDLRATNTKLRERSVRIVGEVTGLDTTAAQALLDSCDGEVKTAIVAHTANTTAQDARSRLERSQGLLRDALTPLPRT